MSRPQKKCIEEQRNLCLAFIDLTYVFDIVNREMLLCVMQKSGCPAKFTAISRALYEGMRASVLVVGDETPSFDVKLRVKQECVIALVIFNIYLSAATILFRERLRAGNGIELTYRLDGTLFKVRRLQLRTKISQVKVFELQYADHCVFVSCSPEDLQETLNVIYDIYSALCLVINTDETEVLHQ